MTMALFAGVATADVEALDIAVGKAMFDRIWVSAPSSTRSADGLGPLFNARSCVACHPGGGGGTLPMPGRADPSLLLRLGGPGGGDPVYGIQLQTFAVPGLRAEGAVTLAFSEHRVALADGGTVLLRRPEPRITDLAYGPLAADTRFSARLAPKLAGAGLLEAIESEEILAMADPDDADADGISGRVHALRSEAGGVRVPGRFGYKASAAGIDEQTRIAFVHDIGISVPGRVDGFGECSEAQADCRAAWHGNSDSPGEPEISARMVDLVNGFVGTLPPPARPARDAAARAGEEVFHALGCQSCHRPAYQVRDFHGRQRRIEPYTDLLLHDMGEGLADDFDEGDAGAREWRTAPLWGLAAAVDGTPALLHDGRARSVLEAILWHGGEAAAQAEQVRQLPTPLREQLIAFLESL